MQITLHRTDLEQFVQDKVNSGEYPSPEAVIESALETLRVQQSSLPAGEELERLIAEGQTAADRGELIPGDHVFRELREHSAHYRAKPA